MLYQMSEFIFKTKQYCVVCKYNVVFIEMLTLTNSPTPFKPMTPFILPNKANVMYSVLRGLWPSSF